MSGFSRTIALYIDLLDETSRKILRKKFCPAVLFYGTSTALHGSISTASRLYLTSVIPTATTFSCRRVYSASCFRTRGSYQIEFFTMSAIFICMISLSFLCRNCLCFRTFQHLLLSTRSVFPKYSEIKALKSVPR